MTKQTTQKKTVNKIVSHSEQPAPEPVIHKLPPALHRFCTDLSPAAALTSFLWAWWRAAYRSTSPAAQDDMRRLIARGGGPVSDMVQLAFDAGLAQKEWQHVLTVCTQYAAQLKVD